jgi:hypothetical protein
MRRLFRLEEAGKPVREFLFVFGYALRRATWYAKYQDIGAAS